MDKNIDPCDDFYEFTCGNFLKSTIVPDDKDSVSISSDIVDTINTKLKITMEEPLLKNDTQSLKLVKKLYQTCMNTSKIQFFYVIHEII